MVGIPERGGQASTTVKHTTHTSHLELSGCQEYTSTRYCLRREAHKHVGPQTVVHIVPEWGEREINTVHTSHYWEELTTLAALEWTDEGPASGGTSQPAAGSIQGSIITNEDVVMQNVIK